MNAKTTENLPILIQKSNKTWLKYKKNCAFKSTCVMFTKKDHKKFTKIFRKKFKKISLVINNITSTITQNKFWK